MDDVAVTAFRSTGHRCLLLRLRLVVLIAFALATKIVASAEPANIHSHPPKPPSMVTATPAQSLSYCQALIDWYLSHGPTDHTLCHLVDMNRKSVQDTVAGKYYAYEAIIYTRDGTPLPTAPAFFKAN